jgi:hypothetical protein
MFFFSRLLTYFSLVIKHLMNVITLSSLTVTSISRGINGDV